MKLGKAKSKQLGFTLLEVLVAVAIFALAGGAVVKAASEHIKSVNLLKNITFATWVANNQLTEALIENKQRWPARNNLRGQTEMADATYYWLQTVAKTQDDDLNQVTVSVYLNESMDRPITSVATFVARETD